MRDGDPEPYLAHAARRGRLAVDDNPTAAKERLLADWWRTAEPNPTRATMFAYHRTDVDELNEAAHALMLHGHRLRDEVVTLGGLEYRVGEQVLCRHNDERLGLRNGMLGTVVELQDDALLVRDRTRAVHRVPFVYASEHLEYGYALTGHAAQGVTVDRAHVLLSDQGALQEWGYVACSRARLETRLYLADREALERETPVRQPDPIAPPERAARALQRSSAESLALDQRGSRDAILDRIAQQHDQLDVQRASGAEQVARAQRELQRLHRWNRGRRAQLETEIARQEKVLDRFDAKAQQLRRAGERRSQFLAFAHQRRTLARSPAPEPLRRSPAISLDREPPGRGLEL